MAERAPLLFLLPCLVVCAMDEAWDYSGSAAMLPTYVSSGQRYTSIFIESEILTSPVCSSQTEKGITPRIFVADKLAL